MGVEVFSLINEILPVMEDFLLKGTKKTPTVFLKKDGTFVFSGTSMPEDAANYYFNIMDWLSDYFRSPADSTHIKISFRYLNSASSSMIYKIFHLMNRLPITGRSSVNCTWTMEEDDQQMFDFYNQIKEMASNIQFTSHAVYKIEEKDFV
ncbi:MAG: DUF1987 domain-containing protein [Flavobacteriales bacterium]|nr:DUF1987 domain-containing protein [Flavobacteriales bacterium]